MLCLRRIPSMRLRVSARPIVAAASRGVLALMVMVIVLQGFALSMQRGAGRSHVHVAEAALPFAPGDADHDHAHAHGIAHQHDQGEAGVLYLDEDRHEPAPSTLLPQARDLDKLLPAVALRPVVIEREARRADAPPLIRSVVVAPAERPPEA
jgi:hypothetical protein